MSALPDILAQKPRFPVRVASILGAFMYVIALSSQALFDRLFDFDIRTANVLSVLLPQLLRIFIGG